MYKHVLVPLDGSPVAEAVLPFLLEIAGPLDMSVVLLRVNEPIPPAVVEASRHVVIDDVEGRRRDALEYLGALAISLRARGIDVDTVVRRGEPATEILAAAREAKADLIAMTTHGRTGLGRLLFGSVAEAVLRRAEVPVFLLRQAESAVRAMSMAGSD